MTEETVTPIFNTERASAPLGRQADIIAAGLAALGALLSVAGAIWFFAGFAENDTRPEHLASAFTLTLMLFAFAIVPFSCVVYFARRAYRHGTTRPHLYWTLFLMVPWVFLSSLAIFHTPLPMWCGLIIALLAVLLSLWAIISLFLERRPKVQTR